MDQARTYPVKRIIFASGLGTMIEWYDFYIFGSLSAVISELMFPTSSPAWAQIKFWAVFATGFVVRPFGALVFGRVGDLIGRKYAFLVTLTIMGLSTFLIGLTPTYATIGVAAPLVLLILRLLQGLALGGEYGGAAVYVAEHVPDHKRGFYTSFIQITATLGLFVSLGVVLAVKESMSDAAFKAWGWRLPFLLSIVLVAMSLYIRLKLKESPLFAALKRGGQTSLAPLKESFARWANIKIVLLPEGNRRDLTEVPDEVKEGLKFVFAERVEDVWKESLIPLYIVRTRDRKYDEAEYKAERQNQKSDRDRPEQR